jgi:hypothetical protein
METSTYPGPDGTTRFRMECIVEVPRAVNPDNIKSMLDGIASSNETLDIQFDSYLAPNFQAYQP